MNKLKDKITLELLINELIVPEATPQKTELKKQLIIDLIERKINYVPVIQYYYDIK